MIVGFSTLLVAPDVYLVLAIMFDSSPVPIGLFDDEDEAKHACECFESELHKSLH